MAFLNRALLLLHVALLGHRNTCTNNTRSLLLTTLLPEADCLMTLFLSLRAA
jgi:hypothetical protein